MNLPPDNYSSYHQESEKHADKYDRELESANLEVEAGNFMTHEDVERLFQDRRNTL